MSLCRIERVDVHHYFFRSTLSRFLCILKLCHCFRCYLWYQSTYQFCSTLFVQNIHRILEKMEHYCITMAKRLCLHRAWRKQKVRFQDENKHTSDILCQWFMAWGIFTFYYLGLIAWGFGGRREGFIGSH